MTTLLLTSSLIWLLAIGSFVMAYLYCRRLQRHQPQHVPDAELPTTLVMMSLRGGDEGLLECLQRLGEQNYPRYRIKLIVDHPTDPAKSFVDRFLASRPNVSVTVEYLQSPSRFSTLKSSAIRQAVSNLDPDIEAVVNVDGDADPYPNFLRDLVSPLRTKNIGAVSGNRWYAPPDYSWGGWCRAIYNALALPAMELFRLPWAGAMSFRAEVAKSAAYLEKLEKGCTDEPAVVAGLKATGLELHFSPQVILANPEGASLTGCFHFISRQLLWTRCYHPSWTPLLLHAVGSYALLVVSFFWGLTALATPRDRWMGEILLGSLAVYLLAAVGSMIWVQRTIERVSLRPQGRILKQKLSLGRLSQMFIAAPMTLVVYTLAMLFAAFTTKVAWRGVQYTVENEGFVKLIAYQPLAQVVAADALPTATEPQSLLNGS